MSKEESFTRIIRDNEGIIYKITRIYTSTVEDQNDLYQEIVFQLWKSFDSFRGDAKVSTWMYRIALNTALFHSKRAKKRGYNVSLDGVVLQHENYDPVFEERLKVVYEQIRSLNDIEKGIILLFLEGKKHEEIASITGFSKSNIGTRIGRIKEKLRKQIIK
ncbi:MAG: sigma-70 family RNA polymerase sigma factor [Bacteroidia bacterium]|nr:sigma-70 family RNA polymerase sigma factor [Bacteroidia bacterium]NNF29969.1 sigma-70 family RNA polymerase sigma factor [Flavobacteriaceae bacterium]MBT8276051.1 sigma-70 family RNA polymerase sigma factor [Bacteroidia bacterium]NNJ81823.1 sigma-70 family RNA polymerase sigma factor [Flavobacteriaceae bacterium]NNK53674.1 sigma-70 family RNA polymerase sigma factor [Flavobacteriaceae bacterium]